MEQQLQKILEQAYQLNKSSIADALKSIAEAPHILTLDYDNDLDECKVTLSEDDESTTTFSTEETALFKAKGMSNLMDKYADKLEELDDGYDAFADKMRFYREPSTRQTEGSPLTDLDNAYAPIVISKFDYAVSDE